MKRVRKSMFDPYREQITEWCAQGMSVKEMADRLEDMTGELFFETGIYAYIYRHNLRFRPWQDVYDARNQCSKCEFCHTYTNTNNGKGRICSKSWRTIQPNVRHSPTWCEL